MSTFAVRLSRIEAVPGSERRKSLRAFVRRRWNEYLARRSQRLAAARLRSLSDYQLKDIGISRGQINMAVMRLDVRGEKTSSNR